MRLDKRLANLGYGSRAQVRLLIRAGRVRDVDGRVLSEKDDIEHSRVVLDGIALDPPAGVVLMLHKPAGYTCSTKGAGRLVYDLLPPRFRARSPVLATVGRLDRDTTGLLLLTDDGALLHRIIHPKRKLPKRYIAQLARDLHGDEAEVFARGDLMLASESAPLAPALLQVVSPRQAVMTITEGRYHQVRRMFAAVGNHVEALHRSAVGGLELGELPEGRWRVLEAGEVAQIFTL